MCCLCGWIQYETQRSSISAVRGKIATTFRMKLKLCWKIGTLGLNTKPLLRLYIVSHRHSCVLLFRLPFSRLVRIWALARHTLLQFLVVRRLCANCKCVWLCALALFRHIFQRTAVLYMRMRDMLMRKRILLKRTQELLMRKLKYKLRTQDLLMRTPLFKMRIEYLYLRML